MATHFNYKPKPDHVQLCEEGHEEYKRMRFWYERHLNDAAYARQQKAMWERAGVKHLFFVLPSGKFKWRK